MKINEAFPSKYLKASDLQGRAYKLTINHVSIEDVGGDDQKQTKPVVYFREAAKGMVLNRTNADTIAIVLGEETDNWVGHILEVFSMRVQGPNGMVDGIRCRVDLPQHAAQPPIALGGQHAVVQRMPVTPPSPAVGIDRTVGAQGLDDSIPF